MSAWKESVLPMEKRPAILDTSVLINFLVLDRLDLLARHPRYRFLVTEHVRAEIADHYPEERQRLEAALRSELIGETTVESSEELDLFAAMVRSGRLGVGECSAIAAASARGIPLAMDDRRARREAEGHCPTLELFDTASVVVDLIRAEAIDVPEADRLKEDWERNHRFRLGFASFGDRI